MCFGGMIGTVSDKLGSRGSTIQLSSIVVEKEKEFGVAYDRTTFTVLPYIK